MSNSYQTLPVSLISESPANPRSHFDDKLIQELSLSIAEKGLLQPILVRPIPGERFEVVAGARRLRACQLAAMDSVQCAIRTLTDNEALEIAVIENLQRKDVHPMDEANAFQAMIDRSGLTVKEIALKIAKTEVYVYQRLKLLDMIPDLQKQFFEGEFGLSHAWHLIKLQPADQEKVIQIAKEGYGGIKRIGDWTAPHLANIIERDIVLDLSKAIFDTLNGSLVKGAGACLNCAKRSGHMKGLFPDIEAEDHCFDSKCHNEKEDAHMNMIVKSNPGILLIATEYKGYDRGILKKYPKALLSEDWQELHGRKSCEDTKRGVYILGWNRGQISDFCTNRQCTKHWSSYSNSSIRNGNEKERDPRAYYDAKIKRQHELAFEKAQPEVHRQAAAADKFTDVLGTDELRVYAWFLYLHAGYNVKEAIKKRHPEIKESYPTAKEWKGFANLSMSDLIQICRESIVSKCAGQNFESGDTLALRSLAGIMGVDVDGIQLEYIKAAQKKETRLRQLMQQALDEKEKAEQQASKASKKEKLSAVPDPEAPAAPAVPEEKKVRKLKGVGALVAASN
jgi:ParB/RepB/Spo0J family partition protein